MKRRAHLYFATWCNVCLHNQYDHCVFHIIVCFSSDSIDGIHEYSAAISEEKKENRANKSTAPNAIQGRKASAGS